MREEPIRESKAIPHHVGIRAVCLRLEGISTEEWSTPTQEIEAFLKERSLLGRVTTLAEVGNAAAFSASDRAGATTATALPT